VSHNIGSVATHYSGIKKRDGRGLPEDMNGHEMESHAPPHQCFDSDLIPLDPKKKSLASDQINRYRWIQIFFDRAVVNDMLEHPSLCIRGVSWQADHDL
jgi:hypothetical protein